MRCLLAWDRCTFFSVHTATSSADLHEASVTPYEERKIGHDMLDDGSLYAIGARTRVKQVAAFKWSCTQINITTSDEIAISGVHLRHHSNKGQNSQPPSLLINLWSKLGKNGGLKHLSPSPNGLRMSFHNSDGDRTVYDNPEPQLI